MEGDLRRQAEEWIALNPRAWQMFCKFTFDAIRSGRRHYGAFAILNRMRWHSDIETRDPAGWKVNNNLAPYLARAFEAQFPSHEGFFRKRRTRDE